jgi:cell wall-associated NlpC family hydrolase
MSIAVDKFPEESVSVYEEIRGNLQNGDVLICSGTGIFSSMIQQATESVWSHVAFILRLDSIDRIMLLESVEPIGVRTVRLSKYLTNYENNGKPYPGGMAIIRNNRFEKSVDAERLTELAQYAIDYFGYPYDIDEIGKIAARILASKVPFTPKQLRRIEPDREFICSEYVARCYQQVGIYIRWNKLGFVAPADFASDPDFNLVAVLKRR